MPAPRFMYWIPLYVTGIPPMLRSRGDRYRDCQSRTSPLFSRCRRST
jgi:steroid 5-alpha reductase family enzyme